MFIFVTETQFIIANIYSNTKHIPAGIAFHINTQIWIWLTETQTKHLPHPPTPAPPKNPTRSDLEISHKWQVTTQHKNSEVKDPPRSDFHISF